ncbi:hypothetical protein L596_022377 [Steinernema carpocapsae]|uniref:Uncharacterized protein n=1 Tax=Steinernema carpocapsae TaxID=34508 RepID=A0A4U5MLK4_STECR|nr:hypothetical protein L596_022377 [Steinernema carpocapsae]
MMHRLFTLGARSTDVTQAKQRSTSLADFCFVSPQKDLTSQEEDRPVKEPPDSFSQDARPNLPCVHYKVT